MRYLHGSAVDQILAQETAGGTVRWMLADHQGTVRDLATNTGDVTGTHVVFDSFGNVKSGTLGTRFAYTGQEYDATTGLYYYNARWYDPKTGRFVSKDPIGFDAGDTNQYRYVGNNSLNFIDPSGKDWLDNGANFFAGFGDTLTFGGTDYLRDQWGINDGVDHDSGAYKGGVVAGVGTQIAIGGAAAAGGTGLASAVATEYAVGSAGYGAAKAAKNLADGNLSPWQVFDLAPFAPGAGYCVGRAFAGRVPPNPAHSAAQFERYKDALRAAMAKPIVQDPTLGQYMDDLYRAGAKIGSGSTAAAVRHELATGGMVGGKTHSIKASEYITALQNWLKNNPKAAACDRAAAENVMKDMQNALNGN